MQHNCPNCAAPLKEGQCRCEYCGTYFYDMVLDMEHPTSIYLYVKTKQGLATLQVMPRMGDFSIKYEPTYAYSHFGTPLAIATSKQIAELNITFDCFEFKDAETGKNCLVKIDEKYEEQEEY